MRWGDPSCRNAAPLSHSLTEHRLDTLALDGTETEVDPDREILDEEVEMYLRTPAAGGSTP